MRGWLTILRWHVRWERLRFLVLLACVVLFTAIFVGISDAFRPEEIEEMLDRMPTFLQKLAGHEADRMLTPEFWISTLVGHPIWLLLMLCFPVAAGLRCLSGLQGDGSLEWILSQPISRNQCFLAGLALVLGGSTLLCVAAGLSAWLAGAIWFPGEITTRFLFDCTLSNWAMTCAVGLFVLAMSASLPRPTSWVLGVLIAMGFLFILGSLWSPARPFSYLSLFAYHHPQTIYATGLRPGLVAGAFGWATFFGLFGWWRFTRRDLE